ncbi:cytochrome c oxidase subunit 4 isoform 1, mitochondrial-like [Liolophura sinensis]|uniref:cytochrome c oxidase subunit 4 isoform 1, mitochondrial-like n=1 Tax=Liolophura sinensis TaxID=3198878 RepID=UPI0031583C86
MSSQLLRIVARQARTLPNQGSRGISISASRQQEVALDAAARDRIYPKLGNRDVVGFGFNGTASYMDRTEFPCPAIRFGENTPAVLALREKEKGDWSKLSIEDKKALYRASFCRTYAEMNAPTGQWKSILATVLLALSATGWVVIWMKKYVYPPMPSTITREWQIDQQRKMISQGQGRVEGIASEWDYSKNTWKS